MFVMYSLSSEIHNMRMAMYFSKYMNNLTIHFNTVTCTSTVLNVKKLYTMMHREMEHNSRIWDPCKIFNCPADYKHALVILNQPIKLRLSTVLDIWSQAQVRVTVDGGINRWLEYLEGHNIYVLDDHPACVPHLITGDMDSASPIIVETLKDFGVNLIETPDQNHTDYTKALIELERFCTKKNIELHGVHVLADTCGRFDHIIGNINTLYQAETLLGDIPVIQIASNSLTWLLKPGSHKIVIPPVLVENSDWCGLIPFGSSNSRVSTTGLKWNLSNACMRFGELISTSNTYCENSSEVTVTTDTTIVWTMGIESLLVSVKKRES